jgi:protein-tyrosine phosphatase
MLACYLVATGCTSGEAIRRVRRFRPQAIETREQEACVAGYEMHLLEERAGEGRDGIDAR